MRHIKHIAMAATLAVIMLAAITASAARPDWQYLFNGKNLDGWTPKITGYGFNIPKIDIK